MQSGVAIVGAQGASATVLFAMRLTRQSPLRDQTPADS